MSQQESADTSQVRIVPYMLFWPEEYRQMNIARRLMTLAFVGVLTAVGIGVMAYAITDRLSRDADDASLVTTAMRHHMEGDMMHDALRADVLAARLARTTEEQAGVRTDLADHAANFRNQLQMNASLPLKGDLAKQIS
jgi:methyl-accepting chemotaxis protein